MSGKKNYSLLFLLLFVTGFFVVPFVSSCGKSGNASKVGYNTQLQIVNLSPDLLPINLYIDFIKQNTYPYYYPTPSSYFYLNSIDTPIQIRSAVVLSSVQNILSLDDVLKANSKYTLFVTGSINGTAYPITSILTADDTAATPKIGFGKIRFVNGSIQNPRLVVSANDTVIFDTVSYKAVRNYVQLPAGYYNFKISAEGAKDILNTPSLQSVNIQDGRLYTIYTYGIISRADTAAFGAGVITNR